MSTPIVIFSLYADPLHVGHLHCIEEAKKLGKTYIIVNNDYQAALKKKGEPFMKERERLKVVSEIGMVDFAILSCDTDRTVCKTIKQIARTGTKMYFLNGGDTFNDDIPEAQICKELDIELIDHVGEKIQSSSTLIKNAQNIPDYKNM